ncbi:hypothetical protein ACFLSA_00805, partial [Bacteroidota bacterium]
MKEIVNLKLGAILIILATLITTCYNQPNNNGEKEITIENAEMRLIISEEGYAKSLIHKATGQECLASEVREPMFAVKQYDPLPGQEMLVTPAEPKFVPAKKIQRNGNQLRVTFEKLKFAHVVTVGLNITDSYIGFTVDNIEYEGSQLSQRVIPPLNELLFLRLPVWEREHF